jgi:hypothetical protein
MASDGGVAGKLASAKAALEHANKTFPSSRPVVQHEFSQAPYAVATKSREGLGLKEGGEDINKGLAERQRNVKEYTDATK